MTNVPRRSLRLARRLREGSDAVSGIDPRLNPLKLRAIDAAYARSPLGSLADLGGVWAVDGGYTLYALERHRPDRAVIVDDDFTPVLEERAASLSSLELIRGRLGDPDVAARVGRVDCVLLFDVLMHQVAPDWDEVLSLYAPMTRCFVIVQPQWIGSGETVRLVDLGQQEYLASVPAQDNHAALFDRLDQVNPRRGRAWRDVHDVWQWGITDEDLIAALQGLDFRLEHFENAGRWRGLERFESRAMVFSRQAG